MSFFGGGGTGFGQTNQSSGFGTGSGFGSSNTGTGRSLSLAHWFFIRFCFDGLRVLPGTIRAALPLNTLLCFFWASGSQKPLNLLGGRSCRTTRDGDDARKADNLSSNFARADGISRGLDAQRNCDKGMQGWR